MPKPKCSVSVSIYLRNNKRKFRNPWMLVFGWMGPTFQDGEGLNRILSRGRNSFPDSWLSSWSYSFPKDLTFCHFLFFLSNPVSYNLDHQPGRRRKWFNTFSSWWPSFPWYNHTKISVFAHFGCRWSTFQLYNCDSVWVFLAVFLSNPYNYNE